MKYQIVLQSSASSVGDYDAMVSLEDLLIEGLPDGSELDGHDAGSGQVNIFIHTHSPHQTFEAIKGILENRGALPSVKAAYREKGGSQYTILWPRNLTKFEVM